MAATRHATYVGEPNEEQMDVPNGGYAAGQIVQAPSGKAGFVEGNRDLVEGERATIRTSGVVRVPALTTLTGSPSAGTPVLVDWDDTNKQIVADAAGNFALGILAADKANGETTALVILNDPGLT